MDLCRICENPLPPRRPGPGRNRRYCGIPCRREAQRLAYQVKAAARKQAEREEQQRALNALR
jgi:hypothetical protein